MNRLNSSKDQLSDSFQQLFAAWHGSHGVWNDDARKEFEKQHWEEFETTTARTLEKLQDVIALIDHAERDMP